MPRFADYLTSVADVTTSTVASDGQVRVNIGDAFSGKGFAADAPLWGVDGFVSRPNDPDGDGAAQVLFLVDGDNKRAFASRDNRWANKAGNLAPGDRAIVSNCAARMFLKQSTSSLVLFTENEDDDGSSMLLELNGQNGKIRLVCGKASFTMSKDGITMAVDGTCLSIDADMIAAFGKWFAANTNGGNLGTIGVAAPPPGAASLLAGPAGMAGMPSTKWTVAV